MRTGAAQAAPPPAADVEVCGPSPGRLVAFLSSAHISPQVVTGEPEGQAAAPSGPRWMRAIGGRWAAVKIPAAPPEARGVKRPIAEFSARSRRALLRLVSSIDQSSTSPGQFAFVTLTYPSEFPSARAGKRDLDNWIKRFERAWGHHWLVWKLEPQKRGAPHFHVLVYFPGFELGKLLEWTARAWFEIAGGGDPDHLKLHLGQFGNRPCVEVVRDWQGVAMYAGKYLGKVIMGDVAAVWGRPGRFWGQRHGELAPIRIVTEVLPARVALTLRRRCVAYYERQRTGWWYIPGRHLGKGRDLPGHLMWGRTLVRRGTRVYTLDECVHGLEAELGVRIRPQMRRWRSTRGGWSGFIPCQVIERWVDELLGKVPADGFARWIARVAPRHE